MVEYIEDIHTCGSLNSALWIKAEERYRELLATLLDCSSSEIAITKNATQGLILAAESIPLRRGDIILTNDLEFPSNLYPWELVARKRGAVVKTVRSAVGRITPDIIEKHLNRQVKVLAISSVQYLGGFRADLEAIGRLCEERGIYLIVDSSQSVGVLKSHVKEWKASMVAGGSQTWLMSGGGLGYLYIKEELHDKLAMANGGWKSVKEPYELKAVFDPAENARRFEDGTISTVVLYGLIKAIELILAVGIDRIEEHVLSLGSSLVDGLESKGYRIVSSQHSGEKSALTFFRGGPFSSRMLKETLAAAGVVVHEASKGIRVSPYFYNNLNDINQLLNALP
jgi:selenocysteine lyase/cysteine desulfurase